MSAKRDLAGYIGIIGDEQLKIRTKKMSKNDHFY